jgi:hypothetical protein
MALHPAVRDGLRTTFRTDFLSIRRNRGLRAVDGEHRTRQIESSVTDDSIAHHVLWHCSSLASSEYATLTEDNGPRMRGIAVLPLGDEPCHIDYDVLCGQDWVPRSCRFNVTLSRDVRRVELRHDERGDWELNGIAAPHLKGCSDIDLGWTPATNTVPIRRLDLEVGETAVIVAAWVRFPELDVIANPQHYTRMAADRWRYRSGEYHFELRTDPSSGLVLQYGDDLWRAVGRS